MCMWLKQSTVVVVQFGPALDKTDGVALEIGLAAAMDNATTGIRVSKNGASYVDRASVAAPVYDAMGDYRVQLDATDTATPGRLKIIFEEAAFIPDDVFSAVIPMWHIAMLVSQISQRQWTA